MISSRSVSQGAIGTRKQSKHSSKLDKFQEDVIIAHNRLRARHVAVPLKWSAGLAEGARHWAITLSLVEKCKVKYSDQAFVGENIWIGPDADISGTRLTHLWYNEINHYDFEAPSFNTDTRNFSQIVWCETTSIGVAKVVSPQGVTIVVARYYPTANVLEKFEENVLRPTENVHKVPTKGLSLAAENGKEDLKEELLRAHNRYRKKHGVPLLKWSNELTEGSKLWAEEVGRHKEVRSFGSTEYGENIIVVEENNISGGVATDLWYDEISNYNFREPQLTNTTGHFTQVVWASSRFVGAAKINTHDGKCIVIARYFPPGNYHENLRKNVKQARSISQNNSPGDDHNVFSQKIISKDPMVVRPDGDPLEGRRKHNRKGTCIIQ